MSDAYPMIKMLHATLALLTLVFFLWRCRASFAGRKLSRLWHRHIPDAVDVLLLGTGMLMMFIVGFSPLQGGWFSVKLVMVLVYILLGMVVLHFGRTEWVRRMAWVGALVAFIYIALLAHFKEILPLVG
jgi:uncharacterized membrane protein SirB2